MNDGHEDPLNLIVEIKGYRGEDAKEKANTMRAYWVPGVNNLSKFGRWAFTEFTEVFEIEDAFRKLINGLAVKLTTEDAQNLAMRGGTEPQLADIRRRRPNI